MIKLALYIQDHAVMSKYSQILRFTDYLDALHNDVEISALYDHDEISQDILDHFTYCNKYDLRQFDINSLDLDAIIVTDPYSQPIIPWNQVKIPIIYKEYGVSGVEVGYGYLNDKRVVKESDMIITESDYTQSIIQSKYPDKYVVTNSPAFLPFTWYERRPHERIRVLWTPHHSIVHEDQYDNIIGDTYSTFLKTKDKIVELVDSPKVDLCIQYHPVLRKRYTQYCKKNGIDDTFDKWVKRITTKNPRIFVNTDGDYQKLFRYCDICINDSISFLQEWLPTLKPMIVLNDGSQYSEYGKELVSTCYHRMSSDYLLKMSNDELVKLLQREIDHYDESKVMGFMFNHKLVNLNKNNFSVLEELIIRRYSKKED